MVFIKTTFATYPQSEDNFSLSQKRGFFFSPTGHSGPNQASPQEPGKGAWFSHARCLPACQGPGREDPRASGDTREALAKKHCPRPDDTTLPRVSPTWALLPASVCVCVVVCMCVR
ncbi:hypothetical protein ElyMa_000329500 [Elysia marginata]|uniref:Uncharacterized protein n=1 Tax=Elysia marginata TaxID=1093978 RepID=A0AAV4FDK2_9GAST|nr:hypothetical protein ElyMa_000329500 [Elysia marginata]